MNWGWFKYYKLSIYRAFNVDTYLTPLGQDIQADMKLWFNSSSPMGPYLVCGNVSNPKYNYFFGKNNMHNTSFSFRVNMSLYKSNIGNFNVSVIIIDHCILRVGEKIVFSSARR